MRVVAVSDLHGELPEIPKCDLLLIAGDVCPVWGSHALEFQWNWIESDFKDWLESVPTKQIVGIAGNHDFIAQSYPLVMKEGLGWFYLEDQVVVLSDGTKIYGSPWTPKFFDWAFMKNDEDLKPHWDAIPDDVDILITHGPPRGMLDLTREKVYAGSASLASRINKSLRPKLHVFGHIHESYGQNTDYMSGVTFANVSLMNRDYDPINPIMEFDL